jgi:hypothetical protein
MLLLATATAITMPALANAAAIVFNETVSADENYSFAAVIAPGDSLEWSFTVLEDLVIETFSVSGTGTDAGDDLAAVTFGMFQPTTGTYLMIETIGNVAAGLGFIDGASFLAGDMFSIFFDDGVDNDVAVTLSFGTQVAAIPLPATGLLLAPFLLAGGVAGLRRRKAARAAV